MSRSRHTFDLRAYGIAVRAAAILPLVDVAVRLVPLRRVCAWVRAPSGRALCEAMRDEARDICRVVRAVSAEWPWPGHCLRTALVAHILLARRGIPASLVVGVARREGFSAHAWIACGGEVMIGVDGASGYAALWTSAPLERAGASA